MKSSSIPILAFIVTFSAFAGEPPGEGHKEYGPLFSARPESLNHFRHGPRKGIEPIHRWNRIAIDAAGLDHSPVAPGEARVFGENLGPGRSSRALAIVHIAIFDAVNAVFGGYKSFTGVGAPPGPVSLTAAISQAAHDTLAALYPSQAANFDALLADDLGDIKNKRERANGIDLGRRAAAAILARKSNDGSAHPEPRVGIDHICSDLPGHWRQDPVSLIPLALGAHWGECHPFVLQSSQQFRIPPPPAMDSPAYAAAYDEAKRLGGDGVNTATERTAEQTFIGTFWAYDGTPSLCAPPKAV